MTRLRSLFRNLVHRDRVDQDLDDEVRAVYSLLVDENIQSGLSPEQAHRAATLELGMVESVKQQVRDERAGACVAPSSRTFATPRGCCAPISGSPS